MMNCRECRERLSDLLEDDFASNEAGLRADLRSHLETCPDCQAELELLRAIREELRAFTQTTAPADLRSRVRAQLIQEKSATKSSKTPLVGSFRLPRLALSGGAALAACCLLILARSSLVQNSLTLEEQNSAPPTAADFHVPDTAFGETPEDKAQRKTQVKAAPAKKVAKNPKPYANNSANEAPAPTAFDSAPPINEDRMPHSTNSKNGEGEKPARDKVPLAKNNSKGNAGIQGAGQKRGITQKPSVKIGLPTGVAGSKANQAGGEPSVKLIPQEPNNSALLAQNAQPKTSRPGTSAPEIVVVPAGPQGPRGAQGPSGPAGLQPNTGNNSEGTGTKGAPGPLSLETFTSEKAVTGNGVSRHAARPGQPLESGALKGSEGARANARGENTLPFAAAPSAPALMADSTEQRPDANRAAPDMMRGPGRSALTITRPVPGTLSTQKADYFLAPGATQVVNLALVPEIDAPLAQLRVTLTTGLRFGDEAQTELKNKALSNTQAAAKVPEKPETSRFLWRGPVQKGAAIENAVEIKALAPGRHTILLSLESLDGKPLQTKSVLFQIEAVPAPEKPATAPGAAK